MRRPNSRQSRGANAAEKAFHGWLKERTCCTCGNELVNCHHCVGSSYKHNKVLIGHWFCIPLCEECHKLRHDHKHGFLHLYGPKNELWRNEAMIYILTEGSAELPNDVDQAIRDSGK